MKRETENLMLLLIGVSLVLVTVTGAYTRYVKPSMLGWLAVSAAVLIVLAVLAMVRDIRGRARGETLDHSDHAHRGGVAWLLVLPVVLLVFVVPPALSARAVAPSSVSVEARPFENLPPGPAPSVPLPEVLMRIAAGPAGGLVDRRITVTGFIMRDGDQVNLAKIVIVCCAADAQLARLHLTGPAAKQASNLPDNTWVRVEGTVPHGQRYSGTEWVPSLNGTSVQRIDPPANTYGG
jgi:uncharacterized repeat protein (TIGR03943 family)